MQRAREAVIRHPFLFGMRPERNQRTQGKRRAGFFCETYERRVMTMSETSQASLQRHGNIGGAKIEHDNAEATRAQKLFAGARDTFSIG